MARTYAAALVNAAAGDEAEAVVDELEEIVADVLHGQPQFADLMTRDPRSPPTKKTASSSELFEGRALPRSSASSRS